MFDFTNYNQLSRIVINKVEPKFSNKKLGGRLKQVSEKQWEERFGTEDFLKGHKKEYEFSFSKKNEILYGTVSIEMPGYGTKKFVVHNREMLEGSYGKLKKSRIGGYRGCGVSANRRRWGWFFCCNSGRESSCILIGNIHK